jgi:hypothetical protein
MNRHVGVYWMENFASMIDSQSARDSLKIILDRFDELADNVSNYR